MLSQGVEEFLPSLPRSTLPGTARLIAFGQLLAVLTCLTGLLTTELIQRKVNVPTFQNLLNYLLLGCVYGGLGLWNGTLIPALKKHWQQLLIIAVADVEANFIVVKAYQYTTFTSAQLLDCFSIPFVMILSWLLLKSKFSRRQLCGVSVCLLGMGGVIYSDAHRPGIRSEISVPESNPVLGDTLCIVASALYACSNVGEEYSIRDIKVTHFLAGLGLFGTLIDGIQFIALELTTIQAINWDKQCIELLIGYSVTLFLLYSLTPVLIKSSSATLFNLSLLSADVYSLLMGMLLLKYNFYWLYFLAFAGILIGLIIYLWSGENTALRSKVQINNDEEVNAYSNGDSEI